MRRTNKTIALLLPLLLTALPFHVAAQSECGGTYSVCFVGTFSDNEQLIAQAPEQSSDGKLTRECGSADERHLSVQRVEVPVTGGARYVKAVVYDYATTRGGAAVAEVK